MTRCAITGAKPELGFPLALIGREPAKESLKSIHSDHQQFREPIPLAKFCGVKNLTKSFQFGVFSRSQFVLRSWRFQTIIHKSTLYETGPFINSSTKLPKLLHAPTIELSMYEEFAVVI